MTLILTVMALTVVGWVLSLVTGSKFLSLITIGLCLLGIYLTLTAWPTTA